MICGPPAYTWHEDREESRLFATIAHRSRRRLLQYDALLAHVKWVDQGHTR